MSCQRINFGLRLLPTVLAGLISIAGAADLSMQINTPEPVKVAGGDALTVTAPKGDKNWYNHGLVRKNDSAWDLRDVYALRFEARNLTQTPYQGQIELRLAEGQMRRDILESAKAKFTLAVSPEWQSVKLPIESFDFANGERYFLKFIQKAVLSGGTGDIEIRNIKFVAAPAVKATANIRSKPADGGTAQYDFTVTNYAEKTQTFRLKVEQRGWEAMAAKLSTDNLTLKPGESATVKLTVTVPDKLAPGAHESQIITVSPQTPGLPGAQIEFITVKRVPMPFIQLDAAGWEEVRQKAQKYDWAKNKAAEHIAAADKWQVPTETGKMSDQGTPGVFVQQQTFDIESCVIAWQLTGDDKYFQKMRQFLLLFSDPVRGYPPLLHATTQGMPQEGGMFHRSARAYEVIYDKLNPAERAQIENTFRLYIDVILDGSNNGSISNWTVFNQVPAAACALLIHDMARFNDLVYLPTGALDQFRYGTMNDGWWYEMSITYNLHCAEGFTQLALMARNFGIDFLNVKFPAAWSDISGRKPYELTDYLGMDFKKSGPTPNNMVGIKSMWDGIVAYPDYRGVMFGMGDGHEVKVGGGSFELAYFAFRDPRYAAIIKGADPKDRDLVYGVAELPADAPVSYRDSARSDNAGIAVLRSQTGEDRNRIQLGFKYGTHGGYHGHFDRLSLLFLMRYGRGFWNPESVWYGYPSYLYKFWVQPSLAHNMVTVDGKQQVPAECRPLLFHAGKNLQAVAADHQTKWSNPPYLGGYDKIKEIKDGSERYLPIPDDHPAIGELTGYTDQVYARRLQIVTDDYAVIADYLKSAQPHTFDQLLHVRGARVLTGLQKTGHREQFDASPLSSGQFIVNVDEYDLTAPAKFTSLHHFNEKGKDGLNHRKPLEMTDNYYHEPGDLAIDALVVWPPKAQFLIGDYPETQPVAKRLNYQVSGDGKELAAGMMQPWILGKGVIDADITNVKELTLQTVKDRVSRNGANTLFWADAKLITADGKTVNLSDLVPKSEGLLKSPAAGVDYYGGPVRLAGAAYLDTIGAEPAKEQQPGKLVYDIGKLNAVRFTAVVGGDFPVGDEGQLRKTTSVRTVGDEAKFVTVLEPRENTAKVKSARALDAGTIEVTLVDGTVDTIKLVDFYSTSDKPSVELYRNGKLLESTK